MRRDGGAVRVLLAVDADPSVRRRLQRLADEHGLSLTDDETTRPPAVVVVDADAPDVLDRVRDWRERWPDAVIAGHVSRPDRDAWLAAQRAGCDVVCNRGALVVRLRELLRATGGRQRRFPLLAAADVAGRLGCVARVGETPVGPVAVYHVGSRLYALSDRCPHAGATLSEGELDGPVLTCPGHGSQFDVRTGERLRGPADCDLAVQRVVTEGGQVSLVLDGPTPGPLAR